MATTLNLLKISFFTGIDYYPTMDNTAVYCLFFQSTKVPYHSIETQRVSVVQVLFLIISHYNLEQIVYFVQVLAGK